MDQALPIEATAKTVLFAAVATPPKEKKRKRSRQPKQPKARQPKIKGKKSGFFSFVKWTIAAALVAGPVGSAIWEYFTPYRAAAKDLPKAIAEYKRAGLPWTAAQLDKYANLPDGQNAAMYISASGQVVSALNLDKSNPKVIAALESGDVAEAAKLLELYRPVVGYAMLASKRDHLSFHRNWKAGPSLTFPEESEAAKVVDVIDLYAELEALRGHGQQSATYLRTSLKIGSLVSDEPAMIGALMALGCRVRAWNAASRAATLLARRPQELTAFEKTLKFEPPDIHLRDALRGEEYMGLTIGRNAWMAALMTQSSPSSTHEEPQPTSTEGVPSSVSDQALMDRIIRYWIEVDTILRTNPDPVTAGARMDQMSTDWQKHASPVDQLVGKVSMVFSQAGVQFVEDQALERTTQALLKVLEYKAKNGSYPARLSQVGNWIDPFTGRPLCMVVNGASIKVYSVGPDRIDNKGADRSQVRSETGWDLVSQSPPPKRALRK